jgi:hypothetical protein
MVLYPPPLRPQGWSHAFAGGRGRSLPELPDSDPDRDIWREVVELCARRPWNPAAPIEADPATRLMLEQREAPPGSPEARRLMKAHGFALLVRAAQSMGYDRLRRRLGERFFPV